MGPLSPLSSVRFAEPRLAAMGRMRECGRPLRLQFTAGFVNDRCTAQTVKSLSERDRQLPPLQICLNRRMADPVILFVRTRCSRTRSGHLSDVAPAPRRFDVTGTRLEPGGMHAALVPPIGFATRLRGPPRRHAGRTQGG